MLWGEHAWPAVGMHAADCCTAEGCSEGQPLCKAAPVHANDLAGHEHCHTHRSSALFCGVLSVDMQLL